MKNLSVLLAFVLVPAIAAAQTEPAAAPAVDDKADALVVYGGHTQPKPIDPVAVRFDKVTVKSAKFDPKKIAGGTAEVEIDVHSLKTDSAKRDAHLKSGDYVNAEKFATINVKVANVKKKADKSYTADATVSFMGATYKWPVSFEVLETLPDGSVRVRGEHKFARNDIKLGKPDGDSVAQDLRAVLTVTVPPRK
jgi:polyisoprenoid-binding protein YceI